MGAAPGLFAGVWGCWAGWWGVSRRWVLGAVEGAVGGVVRGAVGVGAGGCGGGGWWGGTGRRGGGCWGLCWARWRVWCEAPWGWVLGAVEGAVGGVVRGAVGVGAGGCGGGGWWGGTGRRGGGCWGLCWARWRVWCEAPWGWVLGAVAGRVKLVQSPPLLLLVNFIQQSVQSDLLSTSAVLYMLYQVFS